VTAVYDLAKMAADAGASHAGDVFDALMEVVNNPVAEEEHSYDSIDDAPTTTATPEIKTKAQLRKERLLREKQAKTLNRMIDAWATRKKVSTSSSLLRRIKDGVEQHPEFDKVVDDPQNQTLLTRILQDVGGAITADIDNFTQQDLDDLGKFNNRTYALPHTEAKRATKVKL